MAGVAGPRRVAGPAAGRRGGGAAADSSRRLALPIFAVTGGDAAHTAHTAMRPRDIYDDMPDGEAQRAHNQRRLAELERDGAARRARIAQFLQLAAACRPAVQSPVPHPL